MCRMAEEVMDHVAEHSPLAEDDEVARKRARRTRMGFPLKEEGEEREVTGCYWSGDGKRQGLYDAMLDKHMPMRGAPTTGGKCARLIYALHKVQHEWFNNGFCNVHIEPHHTPEARDDVSWDYVEMLEFLHSVSPTAADVMREHSDNAGHSDSDEADLDKEDSDEEEDEAEDP